MVNSPNQLCSMPIDQLRGFARHCRKPNQVSYEAFQNAKETFQDGKNCPGSIQLVLKAENKRLVNFQEVLENHTH